MNAFISASDQTFKSQCYLYCCASLQSLFRTCLLSATVCAALHAAWHCNSLLWMAARSLCTCAACCSLPSLPGQRKAQFQVRTTSTLWQVARPRLSSRLFECGIGARCKDAAYIENRRISLATCNWLGKDEVSRAGTQASCGMMQGATVAMLPRQS